MHAHTISLALTAGYCAVFAISLAVGLLAARRPGQALSTLFRLAMACIVVMLLALLATHGLAVKYGPLVTREALILSLGIWAALFGGWSIRAARKRPAATVGLALLTLGLQSAIYLSFMDRVNRTLSLLAPAIDRAPAYSPHADQSCAANLSSLYSAFSLYAQDWGALPPAAGWETNDDLISKVSQNEWLHCPAVSNRHDNKFGYAYNDAVAGRKLGSAHSLSDLYGASTTPLLYDSSNLAISAHDAVASLPKPGRHGGKDNVLYLDGHVAAVPPH